MQIAIQEDMLPGRTTLQRFENARSLGIAGIEVWADGLSARVPEIVEAVKQTGVKVSAVNFGRIGTLLTPDPAERHRVLVEMRQAMANSIDVGAGQLVFVPIYGPALLPNLHPFRSPVQLEAEMLLAYLKQIFTDLAYAMGMTIYLLPVSRYESHFVNRLEQAASIRRKIKNHEHIKLAAGLFHLLLEEDNVPQAIRDYSNDIGYVYLADSNRRLPGQGTANIAEFIATLKECGYDGWLVLECGNPGANADNAAYYWRDLPTSLQGLRAIGMSNPS